MKSSGLRVTSGGYPLGIFGLQDIGGIRALQSKEGASQVLLGTVGVGDCNEEGESSNPK